MSDLGIVGCVSTSPALAPSGLPIQKRLNQDECYWTVTDCDDDFDGFLRVVSKYDGSVLKIPLLEVFQQLGIDREKLAALVKA